MMKQVMTMVVMSAMLLLCGAGHLSPPDIARPGLNVTTPGTIEQAVTELRRTGGGFLTLERF